MKMPILSVVVPVYNEELVLETSHDEISRELKNIGESYELIFVDDGSRDGTFSKLQKIAASDSNVKIIRLSRNFGHQLALTAGVEHALGDAVVVIDADLQDPPRVMAEFIQKWHEGYDVVYGVRQLRKGEHFFKRATATVFYRLLKKFADIDIPIDTGDFRLMSRRVVDEFNKIREKHRFIRGLVSWVGFRQIGVPYIRKARFLGQSKYSMRKMLNLAFDGFTSFTRVPLQSLWFLTLLFFFLTLLFFGCLVFTDYKAIFTFISVASFMLGMFFVGFSLLGVYVGRISDEIKDRPLYVIQDKIGY